MTDKKAKSRKIRKLSRCLRRFPNGRRCRLPMIDASSFFCERHAHLQAPEQFELDLAPQLIAPDVQEFTSAVDINQFLSKLLILLSQDRISPRRGAAMAFTCNLLLRTLPAIEEQLHPERSKNYDPPIIWDIPGPDYEKDSHTSPSSAAQSGPANPSAPDAVPTKH